MLGPVVVHLQAQGSTRLDHDALDLKTRPAVHTVIPTPGPVNLAVQVVLAAAVGVELRDDVLDVLAALAVGHEHRVGGFDHHHIRQPDHADQPAASVDQCVVAVADDHVADRRVALPVLGRHLPDSLPAAQVVPACVQLDHADVDVTARAAFDHRVVDRFGRHGGKFGLARADELQVQGTRVPGQAHGVGDVGSKALDGGQPDRGAQHKHAAVPEVAAFCQVALGSGQIGLFDELTDPFGAVDLQRRRLRGADIAVAGFGPVRRDADDGDGAGLRQRHRLGQRSGKGGFVGHGLVGRRHHQHRVGAILGCGQRGQRQRGCGIAAHRLQQDRAWIDAQLAQLVQQQEAVFLVADHYRGGQTCAASLCQAV